jgi:hypothetical protein
MTGSRPGRIWGLVAGQAGSHGGRVSAADVCTGAVTAVGVTGAWLVEFGSDCLGAALDPGEQQHQRGHR